LHSSLGLQESILLVHPTLLLPVTFKHGTWVSKSSIDGVWMSANLPVASVSSCPFSLSPGNHHAAILDIDATLLISAPCLSIVHPKAWCLNTQLPHTKACYLSLLEDYFLSHCLLPQLSNFIRKQLTPPLTPPW